MHVRISEIANALAPLIQDGALTLDVEAEGLIELIGTLVLYPGGRLDLAEVVVRCEDSALTVAGVSRGSWQVPAMPGFAISEVAVTVKLAVDVDTDAVTTTASLRGAVTSAAGTWQMTAASDGDVWRVSLALGDISLADIMALVPGFVAEEFVPGPLWSIATHVKLSRFELAFDPHEGSRTSVSFAVAVPGAWELLPGKLAIRDTTLALTLALDTLMEVQVGGALGGTTEIGGHAFRVDVGLGAERGFTLEIATSETDLPLRLADAGALLGCSEAIAPLEQSLEALGFRGLRLNRLWFGLDLRSLTLLDAAIDVELVLRDISLRGSLEYPDLTLCAGLAEGSVLDLKQVLERFGVLVEDLPELRVTGFNVELRPGARTASVHASLAGGWALHVGNTALELDRVDMGLDVRPGAVLAELTAWVDVAGAPCSLQVALPALTVDVGLLPGASVTARELVQAVMPPEVTVPAAAPAVVVEQFALAAQPRDGTFTLAAATRDMWPLPFGQGLALGRLKLALAASKEGEQIAPSGSLAGTLALGGGELTGTLKLEQGGGSLSLVQGEAPISLTDVIAGFVPGGVVLPAEIGGLERLQLRGLSGSVDFATQQYSFKGEASLDQLTLGALSVPRATGSLEIAGTGSALERLSIKFDASVRQDLVPALQVDAIAFELELSRAEGGGWTWHVGGSLVAGLFELPKQTLRADASNGELRFSIKSASPLTWSLPDAPEVLSLSFTSLALTLQRDEATGQTAWSFECTSGLQLAGLPRVSGTLGLYFEQDRRGFAFTAAADQGALDLKLPLVPGDERMTIECKLKAEKLSLLKATEWTLSAESSLTWVVPRAGAPDSTDPVDRALALLGKVFANKTTATLAATTSGVSLTVAALPQVPVPVPVLVNQQLVWDRMGSVGLSRLELRLGKTLSASGKIRVGLPEELSNIFGEENGKPRTRVFTSEWALGLSVDEKAGLSLQIESLPINLEASNYFKKETEGGRTWSRFTLGDVFSFRYGSFEDEPGETWVHVDLFDMGEVRFQQPSFGFNGADFSAKVNFDVLRDLRVPTAPLRWLLTRSNMKDLADRLPTHVALLDIHVLDPVTKEFDADRFVATLQELAAAMRVQLAGVSELRTIARAMAGQFNQLPQDLRSYLDVTIPRRLDLAIAVTPATGLGVKFDISAPKEPLRCLIPTPVGVYGLTIRKLSLGEILGGSLLLIAADLDYDFFDLPALVASLALPPAVSAQLTDTKSIQRKFIVKELMCLVVYQTAVPIPIPIWFDQLGFKHHGLEGVRGQLVLGNNLAGLTMGKLVKGLSDLYREMRRFFTEAAHALPADLFQRNGFNLGVHVKPGFVQLPKYLGGALLGSEQELFNLGVDQLLVPLANFLKKPDIGKLLGVIPLQLRHGSFGAEAPLRIGPFEPQAAWLLSTLREFDGLVASRSSQRNAFVDSLYGGGVAAGDASVQLLRETVSAATGREAHEGVVAFARGSLHVPNVRCSVNVFAGMLAAPDRGLLTQFRLRGEVGSLLGLDVGGRVAVTKRPASGDKPATAELSAAGSLELRVLGYSVLTAGFGLQDGELAFAGGLSLFPPGSTFTVKGDVTGKISRDRMNVDGRVDLELAPLPAADARLSLSYEHVELQVSWFDQDWTLRMARKYVDQVAFTARANRPVGVLPGLVTLSDANDDARGPSLELVGPRDASLALAGRVSIPVLRMVGGGSLSLSPGRVEAAVAGKLHGLSTSLALRGESLDRPASFNFAAEFTGDVFAQVTELLHAGFTQVMEGARRLADDAERLFNAEWAKFRGLVERGANEIRAGILETKARIEKLIGELEKAVNGVIDSLRVKDDEIAARKQFLDALRQGAQRGLQWFQDRVAELRGSLESKRQELVDHDAWYERLNDFERFLNWGYYAARRLDLLIATEALPGLLRLAEQELAKARANVPLLAEQADAMLQQLDRMRNGFADELSRHKQAIVDRRRELDHYNQLLLNDADALIRKFGQVVDDEVMKASRNTFALAQSVLGDLEAAGENLRRQGGRPFEIRRLTIKGALGTHGGNKFEARADIVLNTFSPRKVVQDIGFGLDLDDLPGTAARLAKDLWDRRDALAAVEYDEYQRARTEKLGQEYAAVVAERAQLGPEFGETLDKKLLLDMKWTELAEFHHYVQKNVGHSPVLGDAAALTAVFQGVLERYREAAEACRLSSHVRALVQQANPGLQLDVIDPAANLEHMLDLLLQMIQQVLKRAGGPDGAGLSFGTDGAPAPVFRLANLANVCWDEVAGNEQRLIAGQDAALSFDTASEQPSQPQFRLPGAVLFKEPDFAGDSMLVIHVGEASNFPTQIRSLAVLPGHRVRLYVEGAPPAAHIAVTGCVTLPGTILARAEVDRIDLAAELPPPQLAAWATLAAKTSDTPWSSGRAVRYAIAFEYPDGRLLRSGWWSSMGHGAIDADGFVTVGGFACPMLSGISRDPTGKAVARRVYRQIRGEPEVQVARIANNVDTTWTEPVYSLVKPPPPAFKTWLATVPVAGSPVWRPGFAVRYAVEFEYEDGKVTRSGWWHAERQVAGDGYSYHDYAFPQMTLPVDPIGQVVARRVVRQFVGLPERIVARIANNTAGEWTDRDLGTGDRPTPPPVFKSFLVSLPVEGSPVWKPGFGVRYAVEFEYVDGTVVRSGWWHAERQVAGDGYSFHDYALPQMTLPVDPTGQAVARRVIRQFKDRPERMLVRIANNSDTEWTDTDRGSADVPPPPPGLLIFVANLPVAGSPVWTSGFGVRYAVEFEYADGSAVRSPWWQAQTQDADGYSFHWFAFPRMTLPRDPTGEAVARRVIRQFIGLPERVMARITNNTDVEWTDVDRGNADKPWAPLTVNLWSASLPVAASPVWQPGCRVRYAVEFEYTDGTVLRTPWWRAAPQDGDGYHAPAYAMPQLGLPCDPTGMVTARRVVRQFAGRPERVVARIPNNTDTLWADTDRGTADNQPSHPTTISWSANLPVQGSPAWQPGFRVRYALAFEYADGTVVRSDWWRTAEPQDGEGYVTSGYAMPVLSVAVDRSGQVVARRVIRQFLGRPERVVARLVDHGDSWRDTDSGAADMPPPPAPTGNCWSRNLPVAGSPAWQPGFRVRYSVAFEYADGTVARSDWWRTAEPQDGEGYVTSDYAMPVLNIPADPSGQAVARRMIRQFLGRPERVVARVANNTEPTWCDTDSGAADVPPPPPTLNCWSRGLPVAGSPAWQPGLRVRYAVAFEYADGAVVRGDWWRTAEPQDGEGYVTPGYAMPVLNIPTSPHGHVVARRVIRQYIGRPEREIGRIADNTEPTWADTDVGFADMPPRPGLNVWAAHLPVADSPLWQPGFAVRYAIAYEFADGSSARSTWNDDHDGYLSSDTYAIPVLSIPCDPSGRVVARRVIRQCRGRPEREIGRIANNTEPTWADTDAGFADMPPRPGLNVWAAHLPVADSPLWQPGFAVRYAIAYEFADGSSARSTWKDDHDGYLSSESYAIPVLSIPCDPSGRVVARRVIRQCRGRPEREIGRIANNTEPTWADTDPGGADFPLAMAMSGLFAAQRESMEAFFVRPDGALGFKYEAAPGLDLQSFRGAGRITGGVAAVFARQRNHAEVFAVGEGGRLHYFFVESGWMCDADTFRPAEPITGPIAAVFGEARGHSEVFVVGSDGLLQRFHLGGGWQHEREPFLVAGRIKGLAVAYSRAREHAEVYAVDEGGTLHFFHREGGAWQHSLVYGVKVDGAISAVYSPRRGHTEAFFRGDDGRLHFVYAEGSQWKHEHAAFAGMGVVTGALAAVFAPLRQESEVFLRGEDGRLRYVFCHQGVWMVDANTFAPGGAVAGGVAAIFNPKHSHSEVMFLGAGGKLHHFSISGPQGWVHKVTGS